ncbi:unannotated protein [freshwater metagenome]|uniref:Unannotated protein n=1 Tax=freshwater metagenome TaxID=449393 RepID=A0A6J6F9T8_9ZZZZ
MGDSRRSGRFESDLVAEFAQDTEDQLHLSDRPAGLQVRERRAMDTDASSELLLVETTRPA